MVAVYAFIVAGLGVTRESARDFKGAIGSLGSRQ